MGKTAFDLGNINEFNLLAVNTSFRSVIWVLRGKKHKHLKKHLSSSFPSLNLTESPIPCLPQPVRLAVPTWHGPPRAAVPQGSVPGVGDPRAAFLQR